MKKSVAASLFLTLVSLLLLSTDALAHSMAIGGFTEGFWHPAMGLDHILAMISVGVLATQLKDRHAVWSVPSCFVLCMIGGGFLGILIPAVTLESIHASFVVEFTIALSVFLLGLGIALRAAIAPLVVLSFVGLFGVSHGAAHGLEIPSFALSWSYIAGFVLSTTLFHIAGVALGTVTPRLSKGIMMIRYAGAIVAAIGVNITMQLIS